MTPAAYASLLRLARRHSRRADEADDLVQDALLEAVRAGRTELNAETLRWLGGIVRNKARFAARSAARRLRREADWQRLAPGQLEPAASPDSLALLGRLPAALRVVALLALTGHNRREIAYLLDLTDAALRQRVHQLRTRLAAAGVGLPAGLPGLGLDLAYGRIRDALLPALLRDGGVFGSHDPDGHLFVVRRSRNA